MVHVVIVREQKDTKKLPGTALRHVPRYLSGFV